jgi:hypothetical protein
VKERLMSETYGAALRLNPQPGAKVPALTVVVVVQCKVRLADGSDLWEAEAIIQGAPKEPRFFGVDGTSRGAVRDVVDKVNRAHGDRWIEVSVPDSMRRRDDQGNVQDLAGYDV